MCVLLRRLDTAQAGACGGIAWVKLQNQIVLVARQTIIIASGGSIGLPDQLGDVATAEAIHSNWRSRGRRLDGILGRRISGRITPAIGCSRTL